MIHERDRQEYLGAPPVREDPLAEVHRHARSALAWSTSLGGTVTPDEPRVRLALISALAALPDRESVLAELRARFGEIAP